MAVPPLFLAGVGVAGLGLLLHIIGMATPVWQSGDAIDSTIGLYRGCVKSVCGDIQEQSVSSELEAVRAMTMIGCLAGIAGVGLGALFLLLQILGKNTMKIFVILAAACCFAAFVSIIIGVIIYGAEIYEPVSDYVSLGYSFALCIVGALFLGGGGALIFVGGKSVG